MLIENTNPMKFGKQVAPDHYRFDFYMSKPRWISIWYQFNEIQKLRSSSILEVGPGSGLLKAIARVYSINIETLDPDPDLKPDHVGCVSEIPLPDSSYDVVCAFQVLEHMPYDVSIKALAEMARVSRRYVIISLPDAGRAFQYKIHIPWLGIFQFTIPVPRLRPLMNVFNGEHYWEINKQGFPLSRIKDDFSRIISLEKTYRVPENPYHRFFVFDCDRRI
jgi:SAM-dependent methyltransferase